MILGFAHLGINSSDLIDAQEYFIKAGYQKENDFFGLENNPEKKPFLNHYVTKHDISILKSKDKLPIEITSHGKAFGKNDQLELSNDCKNILLRMPDTSIADQLLIHGLGFKRENGSYYFESFIPSWNCQIMIEESNTKKTMLDHEGPSCLAFYVRKIEDSLNLLVLNGAINYSAIFNLYTDRKLNIAMLRMPGGPVIELIEIKR